MSEKNMWLEAAYYRDFRCKCGECRNSCCAGWNIALSMQEYFRIIGMECSDALRRRLDIAFCEPKELSPEHYRVIAPNWMGVCPMLDEDGLCMLQKECGEAALPEVCRMYPRSLKMESSVCQACCSNSCEKVVEMLMDADHLDMTVREETWKAEISENNGTDAVSLNRSFLEIMKDRSKPLEIRVAEICGEKACEDRKCMLENVLFCLETLRRNSKSIDNFASEAMERYTGENALQKYSEDAALFEKKYPRWEIYFENILMNHLLYTDYPYVDPRLDPKNAWIGLQAVYALMKTACAAYTRERDGLDALADALAGIFRLVEHSAFYYNIRVLIGERMDEAQKKTML